MLQDNIQQQSSLDGDSKNGVECEDGGESLLSSTPCSPNQNSRPTSMVIKKANRLIPAHLVAEAISTLHGLDHNLRWSGPITPSEMQYVEQYVQAKYPEYCNGLVAEGVDSLENPDDLYALCNNDDKRKSPTTSSSPSITTIRLEPSKLLDTLAKKASFQGNFMSIPEIQARNRALQSCGLTEDEYLVVFATSTREAMTMVGESYPFFRGNYYMTVLVEEADAIREMAAFKDSKVVAAPVTWLDLRIKGSQLSQYFRRKCKYSPKGLFAYSVFTNGCRSSMHWISEAHRNSWHVLLDATGLDVGRDCLALSLHRPDFVTCVVDITHAQPSNITCLLVRKKSFD